MNKKWLPFGLILLLGVALFFLKKYQQNEGTSGKEKSGDPFSVIARNNGFDRRISYLEYTAHAKCRMDCRTISQAEVEQVMQTGKINYSKSDVKDKPCPSYALEGTTKDGQRVRIVFAQCDQKTKVVTCIDLGRDWECHCPGDDTKHKNLN